MMQKQSLRDFQILLFLVALMWLIEIANFFMLHQINEYALVPRQLNGLPGIVTMHFLHWNFQHLIANSLPLLALGFLVCATGKAKPVTLLIMLVSGILIWLFARHGSHAGASGLVMGYWGFLISNAIFDRSLKNLLIAVLTIILYGGIALVLLDFKASTSFEGHIFGLLSGILSAAVIRQSTP